MWGFVVFNAWFIDRDVKKSIIEGRGGGGEGKYSYMRAHRTRIHRYVPPSIIDCLLRQNLTRIIRYKLGTFSWTSNSKIVHLTYLSVT